MSGITAKEQARLARLVDATKMIVRRVGRWLRQEQSTVNILDVNEKQHGDFVSKADKTADNMLRESLLNLLPGSGIISEEGEPVYGEGRWRWIVDPLDGTSNYLMGLPYWGISVALEDRKGISSGLGDIVMAVIYLPELDQMYTARIENGAKLNGETIRVSERPLERSMVSHWWPMDSEKTLAEFQAAVSKLHPEFGAIRNIGSPAAELCLVAEGTLQGFFARDMEIYDLAAGILIAEEAGAYTTDPWGGNPLESGVIIAGINSAKKRLVEVLGEEITKPSVQQLTF